MAYQTVTSYTEKLVKTFNEQTDAQLDAILKTEEYLRFYNE